MTIQELSQLYYLDREIEWEKQSLAELEVDKEMILRKRQGIPCGNESAGKAGKLAAEIAGLKKLIEKNIQKRWLERRRLEDYINGIDDSLTRSIFHFRYVKLQKWEEVAASVGGNNTENAVKQIHSRYLKKQEKMSHK